MTRDNNKELELAQSSIANGISTYLRDVITKGTILYQNSKSYLL